MLKNILKLEGAQKLTKDEQREISGSKLPAADFPCYCNGSYAGQCSTVNCCISACA
jgi:hypothetical protein